MNISIGHEANHFMVSYNVYFYNVFTFNAVHYCLIIHFYNAQTIYYVDELMRI